MGRTRVVNFPFENRNYNRFTRFFSFLANSVVILKIGFGHYVCGTKSFIQVGTLVGGWTQCGKREEDVASNIRHLPYHAGDNITHSNTRSGCVLLQWRQHFAPQHRSWSPDTLTPNDVGQNLHRLRDLSIWSHVTVAFLKTTCLGRRMELPYYNQVKTQPQYIRVGATSTVARLLGRNVETGSPYSTGRGVQTPSETRLSMERPRRPLSKAPLFSLISARGPLMVWRKYVPKPRPSRAGVDHVWLQYFRPMKSKCHSRLNDHRITGEFCLKYFSFFCFTVFFAR